MNYRYRILDVLDKKHKPKKWRKKMLHFDYNPYCWCCRESEEKLKWCAHWMEVIVDFHDNKNVSKEDLDNALMELSCIVGYDYDGRK